MKLSEKLCELECEKIIQQKIESKNLLSKFSHEIRNPLTLISSSLQLLEKEYPQLQSAALWPQVKQDLDDILALLQDMSSLNNIDVIRRSYFTAESFLAEIKNSCASLMQERSVNFSIKSDHSLRTAKIFADKYKLREAIVNLLLNAADAVSMLKSEKTISLSCTSDETYIRFYIKDNGPGIPAEYMNTLFDPFVTHKTHGTGLGLGIVKNVYSVMVAVLRLIHVLPVQILIRISVSACRCSQKVMPERPSLKLTTLFASLQPSSGTAKPPVKNRLPVLRYAPNYQSRFPSIHSQRISPAPK